MTGTRRQWRGVGRWGGTLAALLLAGGLPVAGWAQQPAPAGSLVFEGVTVVDVERGQLVPAQRVVIVGSRIQAVGGAGEVPTPQNAQVVDARGKYLIPGLWDMHVHPMDAVDFYYPLFLANGVTGIRDAASPMPLDSLIRWREEIVRGLRVGPPRQVLSGKSIDVTACSSKLAHKVCARSLADARRLVDSLKTAGADMLKLYHISSPEAYFGLAAEARRGSPSGGTCC